MRAHVSCLLFALVTALLIPIPASAQTDAECVAVYDANGTRVARANGLIDPYGSYTDIFIADQGRTIRLAVEKRVISWPGNTGWLWFTGADCTGEPFMQWSSLQPYAWTRGTDVWYPDTTAVPATRLANSKKDTGSEPCEVAFSNISETVPAFNFTLPAYTPPFHLELEPCFTPEDLDPEQIINACMKNKGGALRVVEDPADCTSRETPITLLSP